MTTWRFDCGAAANQEAVRTLQPAFMQQGWTLCSPNGGGQGRAFWAKGTTEIIVAQNAGDYPTLSQLSRTADCQ